MYFTHLSVSFKTPYAFSYVWRHNACVLLAFLHRFRRLMHFPLVCVIMRGFFMFLCTRVSLSFKTPYAFYSVRPHNACVLLAFLHRLRRLTRFPPYGVIMRVFFTFLCTRVSLSFKTPYAFSSVWRHNACVLLAFLHRFRLLTRFPPYGVIVYFTRLSVSFKMPYAFSYVLRHNAGVFSCFSALAFLYLLRRLTRFYPYRVTMHVFCSCFCILFDVLRGVLRIGSLCVYFTRLSVSFKTPYVFSSVLRHNACVCSRFSAPTFLYRLRHLTRLVSQCVCFTCVSATF